MKPSKNNVYCIYAKHTKMLFPTESKANNFIKFNADEILDENGFAPIRVYFCESCGGWHVTSQEYKSVAGLGLTNVDKNYLSERRSEKEREAVKALSSAHSMIGWSILQMNKGNFVASRRFMCYVEKILDVNNSVPVQLNRYRNLFKELTRVKKELESRCKAREFKLSKLARDISNYIDVKGNSRKIETLPLNKDDKGYTVFDCIPELICCSNGLYYYAICKGRLNAHEINLSKKRNQNGLRYTYVYVHRMGIVGIDKYDFEEHKDHYQSIRDIFRGQILNAYLYGMHLEVIENVKKNTSTFITRLGTMITGWRI